jgi:hypothetical protein
MAPFSFMFMSLGNTSTDEVMETLVRINLGPAPKIDRVEVAEGQKAGMSKFFVHYSDFTATALKNELETFEERKKSGEVNVRPKRIVYDVTKDGRERYWQIFKCATPAEREQKEKAAEFKPRVE